MIKWRFKLITSGNQYYCMMSGRTKEEAISKILSLETIEAQRYLGEHIEERVVLLTNKIEAVCLQSIDF